MPRRKKHKLIVDTNLWISFLIGKKCSALKDILIHQHIELVISDQIIEEIKEVTQRPKLQKYFPAEKVDEFLKILNILATVHKIKKIERVCRDAKDDFLLALCKESDASFLVTGDKDLLVLQQYGTTQIITAKTLEILLKTDKYHT